MDNNDKVRATLALHAGLTLPPGALVVDAVTGETGEIIGGLATHKALAAATRDLAAATGGARGELLARLVDTYMVRLESGVTVQRERADLTELPRELGRGLELFEP